VTATLSTRGLLDEASERLARAGVSSPRHDAEQLLAHVLGIARSALPGRAEATLSPDQRDRLDALLGRREGREPLQYLLGTAPFRYLDFAVGPGVFVPRPESEILIDEVLRQLAAQGERQQVCIDLCAGSGALGLSLAREWPGAQVHLVERDPAAVAWLRRNAAAAAAGAPVVIHPVDIADALRPDGSLADLHGRAAVVIANPPYIRTGLLGALEPEVAAHDPVEALDGGPDGLDGVRLVVRVATVLLAPGGLLAVEHGDDQGGAVTALAGAAGFADVVCHPDLAGRDRYVTGRMAT
jgi:release factor glutamine methyltransferase